MRWSFAAVAVVRRKEKGGETIACVANALNLLQLLLYRHDIELYKWFRRVRGPAARQAMKRVRGALCVCRL